MPSKKQVSAEVPERMNQVTTHEELLHQLHVKYFESKSILLLDNKDSFTQILGSLFRAEGPSVDILPISGYRRGIEKEYHLVICSPGPGLPKEYEEHAALFVSLEETGIPFFGVCLGMQSMVEYLGIPLTQMSPIVHGQAGELVVSYPDHPLFRGLDLYPQVGRYHSWGIFKASVLGATQLDCLAHIEPGEVAMIIARQDKPWLGVQFHPESILTNKRKQWVRNILTYFCS